MTLKRACDRCGCTIDDSRKAWVIKNYYLDYDLDFCSLLCLTLAVDENFDDKGNFIPSPMQSMETGSK